KADDDAIAAIVNLADGDARAALTTLEVAMAITGPDRAVTVADVEAARSARAIRYEEDDHYDVVSAFIKSVKGSDPDAGMYWPARFRLTCATPTTSRRGSSVTAWAMTILTTTRGAGCGSSTGPKRSATGAITSRRSTERNGRSASGCDGCGRATSDDRLGFRAG